MAGLPVLLAPRPAEAQEPGSAAEVLDAIDEQEADVARRLRALSEAVPAARAFAGSLLADQERHREERRSIRRRLGLPPGAAPPAEGSDLRSLGALRSAQEALVHAHAEGLPALGDSWAVDRLARHMVELARHLAVIDLWIEAEESRG